MLHAMKQKALAAAVADALRNSPRDSPAAPLSGKAGQDRPSAIPQDCPAGSPGSEVTTQGRLYHQSFLLDADCASLHLSCTSFCTVVAISSGQNMPVGSWGAELGGGPRLPQSCLGSVHSHRPSVQCWPELPEPRAGVSEPAAPTALRGCCSWGLVSFVPPSRPLVAAFTPLSLCLSCFVPRCAAKGSERSSRHSPVLSS